MIEVEGQEISDTERVRDRRIGVILLVTMPIVALHHAQDSVGKGKNQKIQRRIE